MLRPAHFITLATLALLCIGLVMVESAGMSVAAEPVTFKSILLSRTALFAALALAAMTAARHVPIRELASSITRSKWIAPTILIIASIAAALVYIEPFAEPRKGAHRWIAIPGIPLTIQPSELLKWTLPLFIAWWGARHLTTMHRVRKGLALPLAIALAVAAFIAIEDLGTAALIFAVAAITLIAAGAKLLHFAALAPIPLAGFALAVWAEPYRLTRLTTFMDPYKDPQGDGFHMIQSLVAIANGQGPGRGLGFGLQKFGYLPEDRTDFLFAIICEELGIVGALLTLTLYAILLLAAATIAKRETHTALKLYALAVLATIGLQAAINLLVVTGLAPTKGIALPMLSSGGTGWILTAFSLGILTAIDATQHTRTSNAKTNAAAAHKQSALLEAKPTSQQPAHA